MRWFAVLACAIVTVTSAARADFEVDYQNVDGVGFLDAARRTPIDGNPGVTLGEQRRLAFEHALSIWDASLNSPVPIRVVAALDDLDCAPDSAVLGGARAEGAYRRFPNAPREDLFYPAALADRLAGEDLEPGAPDIRAVFNAGLDGARCAGAPRWYYGFEAGSGEADFVTTVLHELAHGLGFSNFVDEETGLVGFGLGPFEAHTLDTSLNRYWDEMTSDERAASAKNALNVVWTGASVSRRAQEILATGALRVVVSGDLDWELLRVSESAVGSTETTGVRPLVTWSPLEACAGGAPLDGAVVMLRAGTGCKDLNEQFVAAQTQGASAVLFRAQSSASPPVPIALEQRRGAIPALTLARADFDQLREAQRRGSKLRARVSSDGDRLAGADPRGRVRLSASDPLSVGSSVSH